MPRLLLPSVFLLSALSSSVLSVPFEFVVDSGVVTAVPAIRFSARPTALQAAYSSSSSTVPSLTSSSSSSTVPSLTSSKTEDRATAIFQNKFIIITTVTTTQTSTQFFTSSSFSSCYTTQVAGLTTCSVGQLFVGRRKRMWPRIEDTPIEPVGSIDGKKVAIEEIVIKASRVEESCEEPTLATEIISAKNSNQARTIETGAVAGIQAASNDIIKIQENKAQEEEVEDGAETTTEAVEAVEDAEDVEAVAPSAVDPPVAVELAPSLEPSSSAAVSSSLAHITFYNGVVPTTTAPNDNNHTVTINYDDKFILIRETKTTLITTTQTNTVIGSSRQSLVFNSAVGVTGCFPLALLQSAGIGPC